MVGPTLESLYLAYAKLRCPKRDCAENSSLRTID